MFRTRLLVLLFTLFTPFMVWAVDLQPNDIVAPLPNKNYITVSYLNTENNTLYRNGSVVSSSPVIETQSAIFRGTRTYDLGSLPAVSFIQLPYGSIQPGGSLASQAGDTGVGDLTIATAIWPYHNRVTRTYFGLAGYLISPTGSYSSQRAFNVGENRFRTDLQMGFQTPITSNVDGMIAVDTMWFGGNGQCAAACGLSTNGSLTQKPLTTTQLGPIYRINPIFTVAASYFYVTGGATSVNNTYRNDVANTQRFLLSGQAHTPIGRLSLQYGRDTEIKNGFAQTRLLAVRLMKEF
ncbi:transporter [Polynucleobacter asymbioticus]|uniref:transporter n=1 Tax=Polynucleobacter asymbioticus TaxID=576611 RepID=UPI001BFD1E89|nr:transporter [Polynucleobacter asymbioticus]QWD84977.1 transporter [Polynucleobacter asymbioticus]